MAVGDSRVYVMVECVAVGSDKGNLHSIHKQMHSDTTMLFVVITRPYSQLTLLTRNLHPLLATHNSYSQPLLATH